MIITRFAPSPTGHLHLGNAYSAMFAERAARQHNGQFFLRIEDIDKARCRLKFEDSIKEDLEWLGLKWKYPVHRQSDYLSNYKAALNDLERMNLLYPCFCTRNDILKEIAQSNRAPNKTKNHPYINVYPGTCRNLSTEKRHSKLTLGIRFALRLDVARALSIVKNIQWIDVNKGAVIARPELFGDVILARKDIPTSYHLSVTVDDNLQNINLVTRGEDLRLVTHIHRLLQELLCYDVPKYQFHRLLYGKNGQKYSKRDESIMVKSLREGGYTPENVRKKVGFV